MLRANTIVFLTSLFLLSGMTTASSAVRNFFSPVEFGDRIAFCTSGKDVCGKAVADAWCTKNGFDRAILFRRDNNAGQTAASSVRFSDSGKICTGDDCVSFAQIKCYSQQ